MLVDTNIISEIWRAKPDARATAWLNARPIDRLFISTLTVAELRAGIDLMVAGPRRDYLDFMAHSLFDTVYRERILDFDFDAAIVFGRITAHRQKIGRRIEPVDAMIAAIALANQMPLVTRNTKHFSDIGLVVIDPFSAVS